MSSLTSRSRPALYTLYLNRRDGRELVGGGGARADRAVDVERVRARAPLLLATPQLTAQHLELLVRREHLLFQLQQPDSVQR